MLGLNQEYFLQTVTSNEVEEYIIKNSGLNLIVFFDQYLREIETPTLEYYISEGFLAYRWTNVNAEFDMPLKININGIEKWIYPKTIWTKEYLDITLEAIHIDPNFYISSFNITR